MTGRRGRLARLEAARRAVEDLEVIGMFQADPDAGLWREINNGRALPMTAEDVERARGNGGALLMIGPLPGGEQHWKAIYGVTPGDL